MNKPSLFALLLLALAAAACSGGSSGKKVLVAASGNITVTGTQIKLDPGMSHNEQELVFTEPKLTLTVQSTAGTSKTFDLTEDGAYLLNLQADTLIGGLVNYGSGQQSSVVSAERIDSIIDSTKQLMAGTGASDAKKSFFLPPFTLKKVSSVSTARIIGAFKGIPYQVEQDRDGKVPEVYKFFTNKQKRETLLDLEQQDEKIKAASRH